MVFGLMTGVLLPVRRGLFVPFLQKPSKIGENPAKQALF